MRTFNNKAALISSYVLLSFIALLSFSTKGETMSLLPSSQEVVISSPLEGILTLVGKPISGVKIERKLSWFDQSESVEDFVVTNSTGHFTLPLIKKSLKLSNLTQFVVSQEINAIHNGEKVLIWYMGKGSKIEFGELGGKPVNLRCELSIDEIVTRDYKNPLITRCSWDSLESS